LQTLRWLEGIWQSGAQPDGTWIELRGSSMGPSIREGDRLRVKSIRVGGLPRPGEVVLRMAGNRLVAHRLVEIRGGSAVTRGDACRASDSPVPAESLLGRVVEVKREQFVRRWWRRVGHALERHWRER